MSLKLVEKDFYWLKRSFRGTFIDKREFKIWAQGLKNKEVANISILANICTYYSTVAEIYTNGVYSKVPILVHVAINKNYFNR